ncbi:MAG: hypothetical protein EBU33_08155, partial [Sphingobacteriia bacterium]|nr:hypothetical protein [Sphingobacteriia bacterium]
IDGYAVLNEQQIHEPGTPMPSLGIGVEKRELRGADDGDGEWVLVAPGIPDGAIQVNAREIGGRGGAGLGVDPPNRKGRPLGETKGRSCHRALELAPCQIRLKGGSWRR